MNNSYANSFKSKRQTFFGRPDLTPMVDVLFLLLIFFMLSSSFVQVSGIKVELPRVGARGSLGIEKFVITVCHSDSGARIFFNDKEASWEVLKQGLAEVSNFSASGTVIIRADQRVAFGTVARIMALAEKANVAAFIVTMPAEEKQEVRFDRHER